MKIINKWVTVEVTDLGATIEILATKGRIGLSHDELWGLFLAIAPLYEDGHTPQTESSDR